MPSLSLCMIVKDVAPFIQACLASVEPFVDEIIIVDTGSNDETKAKIQTVRAWPNLKFYDFTPTTHPQYFLLDSSEFYEKELAPFTGKKFLADFAAARQFGWEKAQGDFLFWIDSDDIVANGAKIPEIIEDMWRGNFDTGFLNYDYNTDTAGRVTIQNSRERFFRRTAGAKWVGKIHEVCIPPGNTKVYTDVNIVHRKRELGIVPEVANRNLKVLIPWLKEQEKEGNVDPRVLYYLATEERHIWPDRAIRDLARYARVSGSSDERAISHIYAGEIHEKFNRLEEAETEYAKAAMANPSNADAWFGAARLLYMRALKGNANWYEVVRKSETGFSVSDEFSMMVKNPTQRKSLPYVYYSCALVQTQQYEKAIKACDEGMKHFEAGSDEYKWLDGNRKVSVQALNPNKLKVNFKRDEPLGTPAQDDVPGEVLRFSAIQIWKRLRDSGNAGKAERFLESLPKEYSWDVPPEKGEKTAKENGPGKKLDIVFYTGPAWEKWSPKNLETGLGGSELACIYMAREFAKQGHRVRVYNDCDDKEKGMYDGVEYIHHSQAHDFETDVLIVSRSAWAIVPYGSKAKLKVLWVHDVHCGHDDNSTEGIRAADIIFCLSNWHKEYFCSVYPWLNKGKVTVTRNGIDPERFKKEPVKIGNRLIYTSSPDRGLHRLLDLFPRIKTQVPDASLHVYYGFVTWKAMAERSPSPSIALASIHEFEKRLANTPGVVTHGRVGQAELAEGFLAAKVWAYPSMFTETSCISAVEAQAAGCIPVTTALAALNETVGKHGILIEPPNTTEAYAESFVRNVVGCLGSQSRLHMADEARAHALVRRSWNEVALGWEEIFRKRLGLERKTTSPFKDIIKENSRLVATETAMTMSIDTQKAKKKPKLTFIYTNGYGSVIPWLHVLNRLEDDFDIQRINLSCDTFDSDSSERLFVWGSFGSRAEKLGRTIRSPEKFLFVEEGGDPPNGEWDILFTKSDKQTEEIVAKLSNQKTSRAIRLINAFSESAELLAAVLKDGILEFEKTITPAPESVSSNPRVSVLIIMARPGGVDITFAGLRDQTYKNFETIIVDARYEKRHEQILQMAEEYGLKDVIHVPEHRRNGKWIVACAAFNTAIALARGEIVIILHDFVYTPPGWIESHVAAHGNASNRHVVGNHQNVDLPELTVKLPHKYETDRPVTEHDSAFESLDELCIFKDGRFEPSWPAIQGPRQWQPVFSSWFHAGKKPGRYWVTLTNDSFRREFLWDLGGINERFDHGRGPSDMELSARVHAAGGETVYIDEPNVPLFNPRFVMRSLAFGNHKENFRDGDEERWTEEDGVSHWKFVEQAGITEAPNPFDMRELAARLTPWREKEAKCVPLDMPNVAYFRKKVRPTDDLRKEEEVSPTAKPKLVFVHEADDHASDGLWQAVKLLENDFYVQWVSLTKGEIVPPDAEHLLVWGGFESRAERTCRDHSARKALCLGGLYPPPAGVAEKWDIIFGETDWIIEKFLKPTGHRQIFKAFGVNSDIYYPPVVKQEKTYDWISVGAFTSWKRQTLMLNKTGKRLVVGGFHPHHADESAPIVTQLMLGGVTTMPAVPPKELARLYAESKACYIPAKISGGGERAVLEARACGLHVEVEDDNPKLKELLHGPVPSHRHYASALRAGLAAGMGLSFPIENIDVVMPVWSNDEETMILTEDAIKSLGVFPGKLIIVDNGSSVGAERLAKWADILIRNETNLGYAKAANQGMERAGDVVAVANNDIQTSPNWWGVVADILNGDPKVGSVHFRMLPYHSPFTYGDELSKNGRERWCSSSFFVVRNVLRFDEEFESGEDYDFWYRFHKGYQMAYTNRASYRHLDSYSQMKRTDREQYNTRGAKHYLEKYGVAGDVQFAGLYPEQMKAPWKPFP